MNPHTTDIDRLARTDASPMERFAHAGLAGLPIQARVGPTLQVGGKALVNFAASDYLGLGRHPLVIAAACAAVRRWGLSLGMPAALAAPDQSQALEAQFARLTGQEQAILLPSTTHIALDLLPRLAGDKGVILLDEWAYSISLDGARAAQQHGARLARFAHNDPAGLERALRIHAGAQRKVIVVDGVYSAGGQRAPLEAFARLAARHSALIYIDDAHGIGILGANPRACPPYGAGGSGSAAFAGVPPGLILHVASLSKAFGAPLALAAGPASLMEPLRRQSEARLHSSSPSTAVIAAALAALRLNERYGDRLRAGLAGRVQYFFRALSAAGISLPSNGAFPIQSLYFPTAQAAFTSGVRMRQAGLLPVVNLHPPDHPDGGAVRFILTTHHFKKDLQRAIRSIITCFSSLR